MEDLRVARELITRSFLLSPDIVHVHPDNFNDFREKEQLQLNYGLKVLGSYIGTDEYVLDSLSKYLLELEENAESLMAYEGDQVKYLVFINCFIRNVGYIFRTTPPRLTIGFARGFEVLKKRILYNLLGFGLNELSDLTYGVCQLAIDEGGFNIKCIKYFLLREFLK